MVPFSSVFAYYSGVMLGGSDSDRANVWWVAITEFFVFALIPFIAGACYGVLMSRMADRRIVADGYGVLVPVPDSLAHWFDDLGSFSVD